MLGFVGGEDEFFVLLVVESFDEDLAPEQRETSDVAGFESIRVEVHLFQSDWTREELLVGRHGAADRSVPCFIDSVRYFWYVARWQLKNDQLQELISVEDCIASRCGFFLALAALLPAAVFFRGMLYV